MYICNHYAMLVVLLKILIYPISILPLKVMRILLYPVYIFISKLLKYRKSVILKNLRIAFPNESDTFYKSLLHDFYKQLYQLICEGLKSFTISEQEVVKRFTVDEGLIKQHAANKQSVILLYGHFNNWEWSSLAGPSQVSLKITAIYQPLKNKALDKWIKANRQRYGSTLISNKEVNAFYESNTEAISKAFIADQSPSNKNSGVWLDFFGRKTLFLAGAAVKAKQFNHPLFFVDIQQVKPGFYKTTIEELIAKPQDFTIEEIIQRYASRLEKQIKDHPSAYLWSHNRWKHVYEGE